MELLSWFDTIKKKVIYNYAEIRRQMSFAKSFWSGGEHICSIEWPTVNFESDIRDQ